MKVILLPLLFSLISFFPSASIGTVRYVDGNGANPAPPYTNWMFAARSIQDAIDIASAGDLILVTNGTYRTGGWPINSSVVNRVAITNGVAVQSVNGPLVTVIEGAVSGAGTRCAYVANNGALVGFTLTNGLAQPPIWSEPPYEEMGGAGVLCESTNALVTRCIISVNFAMGSGGGAYGGLLENCVLTGNSAGNSAGAASQCLLNHCTVIANSAPIAGGVENCVLNNCISFDNAATVRYANFASSVLNYCCTTPLPASGVGNISSDPQVTDRWHIASSSPCLSAGTMGYASGTDIDGEAWLSPPSIGADELYGVTGPLSVAINAAFTNVVVGFPLNFQAIISGHAAGSSWDFGDGTIVSNRVFLSHSWSNTGIFPVKLSAFNNSNPSGVTTTAIVQVVSQPFHYVNRGNLLPVAPFTSWATAATNIQDAVDAAAIPGSIVLVTNGIYNAGSRTVADVSNRVAVTLPLILRSVNGSAFTVIKGDPITAGVYLADGASLTGFTVTNGSAPSFGGGVTCESGKGTVSNCVFAANSSGYYAGAAWRGTFYNCSFVANHAWQQGGGAYGATATDCTFTNNDCASSGGGADVCLLTNCTFFGNSAFWGGAANTSVLDNCGLYLNNGVGGGGVNDSTLFTCMVVSNFAQWYGGGGARASALYDCVLQDNQVTTGGTGGGAQGGSLSRCALKRNTANYGGGASDSSLDNCLLSDNCAIVVYYSSGGHEGGYGGGSYAANLKSCTIARNSAEVDSGGVHGGALFNCIVSDNSAPSNPNWALAEFQYVCTTPLPPGSGNIANAPLFVDLPGGDFHLQSNSPCINSGNNTYVANSSDLVQNSRTAGGTVDIGAYEYQNPTSIISYSWLQNYGLTADGSADFSDQDNDGMNNWQEWRAQTNPTNSMSLLRIRSIAPVSGGAILTWQSVSGVNYVVERNNVRVDSPFSVIRSNLPGQALTTSYTDTNTGPGAFFYRIRIE